MKSNQLKKQQGFIILMGMLALVLGAAVWFTSTSSIKYNEVKIEKDRRYVDQLNRIKQKMLTYAVLHPEIYSDGGSIPGPGYFPCPDVDGDGESDAPCGSATPDDLLFVLGMVPYKISSRNFSFIDSDIQNDLFWFAVDSRLVASSGIYAFGTSQRMGSVNSTLSNRVNDRNGSSVAPLTVDSEDDIVMVLFYAGSVLANLGQSRPSISYQDYLEQPTITAGESVNFASTGLQENVFNDYVITITRREWESAILTRVSADISPADDVADLCADVTDATVHWFNSCTYTSGAPGAYSCDSGTVDNYVGQGWRSIVCP